MLPGKQYTPADMLTIARRRAWEIIVPCAIVAAGTAAYSTRMPNLYRSEAVILVVPQQIAEKYVSTTVKTTMEERLETISQQILSRTRLEGVIDTFKLYPNQLRASTMEDVVGIMRKDIGVRLVKGDSFSVSYAGRDPKLVQQVAARLASLFIEESLRDRAVLAEGTSQFLEVQLDDARRRLIEHEKKLENYRMKFAGRLPSQVGSNLQALQNTQMQIQATLESINRDRDQQMLVQRQLAEMETEGSASDPSALPAGPEIVATPERITGGTTAQQLAAARNMLSSLELRYKPDHPDIPRVRRLIRDLTAQLDAQALQVPLGGGDDGSASASASASREQVRAKRIKDLQGQLVEINKRIVARQEIETALRARAGDYQAKVEEVPTRESDMVELTRDYGTLQSVYTSLLSKKEDSNIAANLERRQIGEQFKLLDQAQIPSKPYSPDRPRLTAFGVAGGIVVGLALVLLLELRDSSFKTDDEVTHLLALPVLAVVPVMRSDVDRRRSTRRGRLVGVGLGSTVLGCVAVVVYTLTR